MITRLAVWLLSGAARHEMSAAARRQRPSDRVSSENMARKFGRARQPTHWALVVEECLVGLKSHGREPSRARMFRAHESSLFGELRHGGRMCLCRGRELLLGRDQQR